MPSARVSPHNIMPGSFQVGPSKILMIWVAFSGVSAAALSLLYLPYWGALVACLLVVFGATAALRLLALKTDPNAVVAIRLDSTVMEYQFKNGRRIKGSVLPGGLTSRWLTVVRVKDASGNSSPVTLVVLPDSMRADDYRRLRVFLRWGRIEVGEVTD